MDGPGLERLKRLLAGLREERPSKEAERRAVEAVKRLSGLRSRCPPPSRAAGCYVWRLSVTASAESAPLRCWPPSISQPIEPAKALEPLRCENSPKLTGPPKTDR